MRELVSFRFVSFSLIFRDRVENLPKDTVNLTVKHPFTGKDSNISVSLFSKPGQKKGTRYRSTP